MEIDLKLIEYRIFNGQKIPILDIKKGSLLFRLIYDYPRTNVKILDSATETFLGRKQVDGSFCLDRHHNVFFYTCPYVMDTNFYLQKDKIKKGEMLVCETTQNLKVALFLSPSNLVRINKGNKSDLAITCNNYLKCDKSPGISSDPCFRDEFMINNPDIVGMYVLQKDDIRRYKNISKKSFFSPFNKFVKSYRDASGLIGPAEIILYPQRMRKMENIYTYIPEKINIYDYIKESESLYNYKIVQIFEHNFFRKDALYNFMNKILYTFNKSTGFYENVTR